MEAKLLTEPGDSGDRGGRVILRAIKRISVWKKNRINHFAKPMGGTICFISSAVKAKNSVPSMKKIMKYNI